MDKSITIEMGLPPKPLWQNRPCHWTKKREATRNYRYASACMAICACNGRPAEPWEYATCKLSFYWPNNIRRDIRNAEAAMKPAYDGLVDAGLIIDDDHKHLGHEQTEFCLDRERPRVEILIYPPY